VADHLGQALSRTLALLNRQPDPADLAAGYRSAAQYLAWFLGQISQGRRPATAQDIKDAVMPYLDIARISKGLPRDKVIDLVVPKAMETLHDRGLFCPEADARRTAQEEF
jgi:hypothetical protein